MSDFTLNTRAARKDQRTVTISVDDVEHTYHTIGMTRNVAKRFAALSQRVESLKKRSEAHEDVDPDESAHALIDLVDTLLRPNEAGGVGAGELLRTLWESDGEDALALEDIADLSELVTAPLEKLAKSRQQQASGSTSSGGDTLESAPTA